MLSSVPLKIYTDGSSKDGVGSWAYIITSDERMLVESSGVSLKASSLDMEIKAAVLAIEQYQYTENLIVYSDCKILTDAMTGRASSEQISHARFATLRELCRTRNITWVWIKGHNGNSWNERCDQLCQVARTDIKPIKSS